ncbi:leucyl aminopeptidase [Streptomonospora wellingtoniae]|uniref:Probable cytosol aminopeptidase n=1 Tax=Streptomonospora wellingtoniae TaxID=3075544 RepID=A0ABU2KSQ1_9ACTN|nr:leucyl aminopeptidase [Streptomonospora sp. DSM 45055]MDT0302312.1 leucyl aminopeptidase [Streptomonospora sp. DSM 45055]
MPIATEIRPVAGTLIDSAADLVAIPVVRGEAPAAVTVGAGPDPADLVARLPASLADLVAHYELTGKPGETTQFPADFGDGLVRVVLLGVGDAAPADLRAAGAALARAARGRATAATTVALLDGAAENGAAGVEAFVEGVMLASYRFSMASSATGAAAVEALELVGADSGAAAAAVERGKALARATGTARDLINTPSAEKDPAWLAARAGAVAAESGLTTEIWDERALVRDGFGSILAVGAGSDRPPRLVRLDYRPENPGGHVVLVGKGVTFDTGGLSLKPNDNMKLMKTDMSGAAVVLGVMSALAELGSEVAVTGLLAVAENSFSGSAQRPGDVITTYDGHTVEVLNTDAEGRLVMADALGYAVAELAPDAIVDVATLTGAAKLALGTGMGALFSGDDDLAAALSGAAERSGEPVWRLPLTEDYRDCLDSRVADLANIGNGDYGRPGAAEAALFLREFTGGLPWAHLDIAGPGRSTSDEGVLSKGGTGFSTRLLLRWLSGEKAPVVPGRAAG